MEWERKEHINTGAGFDGRPMAGLVPRQRGFTPCCARADTLSQVCFTFAGRSDTNVHFSIPSQQHAQA